MADQHPARSERTPPEIVAAACKPNDALAAFVAQELEHWGFDVQISTSALIVKCGERELMVGVGVVR